MSFAGSGSNSVTDGEVIIYADNMSFNGSERSGAITANGELWIGSTVAPHVRKGSLTGGSGITITPGAGSITISAIPNSFSPNVLIQESDDFLSVFDLGTVGISKLNWYSFGGRFQPVASTAANPGVVATPQAASLSLVGLTPATAWISQMTLGGGAISINFVHNITTLSVVANRYNIFIGFIAADSISGLTSPTNGCYFSYTDNVNSGNWVINCTKASVTTSVNTSIAGDLNFHNFGIEVNAAGSSAVFKIDGLSVGTISTNMPIVALSPTVLVNGNTPVALMASVDLFYMTKTLTTAR